MEIIRNLNWNRIVNIARWDINTHRQAYVKYSLLQVGVYVIMTMYSYVMLWLGSPGDMIFSDKYVVMSLTTAIGSVHWLQGLLLMSTMFHGLHTRQGRVNELTLPATNLERFLWNVIRTVGANWLFFVVGVLLADLFHAVFVLSVWGSGVQIYSITLDQWHLWSYFYNNNYPFFDRVPGVAGVLLVTGLLLLSRAFVVTFALGSAWKYRRSFATTVLYHILFWAAVVMSMMVLVTVLGSVMTPHSLIHLRFLTHVDSWLWGSVFVVIAAAIYCGIWYLTYRLYCQAQITTRRNP